ncbi:MAG: hypothetical protein PHN69_06015 [Candidatus Pacebacteria bacterium]|nr:hypothetical protein [Candidatus Paceibacterota bacterium]
MILIHCDGILLRISFSENSKDEIDEIDVIFGGKSIYIISNNSYRSGFDKREENTQMLEIKKNPELNPYVLCEDVAEKIKDTIKEEDEHGDVVAKLATAIQVFSNQQVDN